MPLAGWLWSELQLALDHDKRVGLELYLASYEEDPRADVALGSTASTGVEVSCPELAPVMAPLRDLVSAPPIRDSLHAAMHEEGRELFGSAVPNPYCRLPQTRSALRR